MRYLGRGSLAKSVVMSLSSLDRKALVEAHARGESNKDLALRYGVSQMALSRFFNRQRSCLRITVWSNDPEFTRALTQLIETARDSSRIKMAVD